MQVRIEVGKLAMKPDFSGCTLCGHGFRKVEGGKKYLKR